MKKILLSVVCLIMVGIQSVVAQARITAPVMPGEITVSDSILCYLYNVGAERFLGTSYGPAQIENYGEKLLFVQVSEGVYNLKRQSDNYYYYSESGYISRTSGRGTSAQFKFNKVDGGYTIQRMYSYNETQFVGVRADNTVYSDETEGNIVWKLLPATEATELYMAQAHLYRSLIGVSTYQSELYSQYTEVYNNTASTAAELTASADALDKAMALMVKIETLSWESGDYQMFFEDDPNHVWSNTSTGWLSYSNSKEGAYIQTLTASVIVDKDATLRYQVSNDYNGNHYYRGVVDIYIDGSLIRTVNNYELDRELFFCDELTVGKHIIQWVFNYTGTQSVRYYIKNIATYATPLITVTLPEAGSLGTEVLSQVDNMSDVRRIKISGKMNSDDFARIDMMTQLFSIDMSETDVKDIPEKQFSRYAKGDSKSYLHKIVLPKGLETIGDKAFDCTYAEDIVFPATLKSIGEYAFSNCRIREAIIPDGVTNISRYAFLECRSLTKLHYPIGTTIVPDHCFENCYILGNVELPEGLTAINGYAFNRCYPLNVRIPSAVTSIGSYAFNNDDIDSLVLTQATTIGSYAFRYNNLKHVVIAENSTVGEYTFGDNQLEYVEFPTSFNSVDVRYVLANNPTLKTLVLKSPTVINGSELSSLLSSCGTDMVIKVPDYLVSAYKLATYWNGYSKNIEGFSSADVALWYINQPLTLRSNERFEGSPSVVINGGGSLTINGETAMALNDVTWYKNLNWPNAGTTAMVLSNCESIKINGTVSQRTYTTANRWYFLCLPFNFKVSDIVPEGGAKYAIRYYDGVSRAANQTNKGNWKDLPADTIVTAGTGFIYQTSKDEYTNFYAVNDADKQNIMGCQEYAIQLKGNYSENPAHSGWNLVGNPYLAYYNIHKLNFTAPITVWEKNNSGSGSYKAYSIIDDDYAIKPLEILFVQCPDEINTITFPIAGRQLTSTIESQNAPALRAQSVDRKLIDLELTNGDMKDQTRVVFNDKASMAYETSCDASKFMSEENCMPQIYTLDNVHTHYAINERPAQEGTVQLGLYIPSDGVYSLNVKRNRNAGQIYLKDLQSGKVVDITDTEYNFSAEAGTLDNRFLLMMADVTGIREVTKTTLNRTASEIYDLSGRKVNDGGARGGIYIIRENGKTRKVNVK